MKITIEFDDNNIREYEVHESIAKAVREGMALTIDTCHPDFEERMRLTVWEEDVIKESDLPDGWKIGTFRTRRGCQDEIERKD